MRREFKLPDVGEGLTEAEIVRWHVKEGDAVKVNQIVVEIETAKSIVELPIPWDGVVAGLMAGEGDTIDVGVPIIAVDTAEDGPSPGPSPDAASGTPGAPGRGEALADDMVPSPPAEGATAGPAPKEERQAVLVGYGVKVGATKRRPRKRAPSGPASQGSRGTAAQAGQGEAAQGVQAGQGEAARPAQVPTIPAHPVANPSRVELDTLGGPPAATPARVSVLAKPPVRKLAKDLGVDLTTVAGTGPEGSITRDDVRTAAQATRPAPGE
ncbi:biotin/lipoyl-containing protein, partial [Nonomuraea lactucae]|uniref:biotin/lipoyl-containing protein n=1 Tax=Nonomuraea lactucae TaxID=2249762 RepID=UPI001965D370